MRRVRASVTIPDEAFVAGERLASVLRISRSQRYTEALVSYPAREDELITEAINRAMADPEFADPELDAFVEQAARLTFERLDREEREAMEP
jgi:hypothetical protein